MLPPWALMIDGLAGAAGQLCDVFAERQRRELQAFDCGEIRKNPIHEVVDGEALLDREHCGLDVVRTLWREDMMNARVIAPAPV